MKITIFHLGFFYSGGGERLVLEEISGLKELGHEVTCYAPIVDRDSCFPELMTGNEVRPLLPQPPKWLPFRTITWIILSCLLIPLLAGRFRDTDVFMGANQPGPWFAWVVSQILRKPYIAYMNQPNRLVYPRAIDLETVLTVKGGDYRVVELLRKVATWFIAWVDTISVAGANVLLADGDYIASQIQLLYGRPVLVCPAGCHPSSEGLLDYESRWGGELKLESGVITKPYVLLTNRHFPQKRFEYVINSMPNLLLAAPDFSLVITGEWTPYTAQLRELVRTQGLEKKVHFVGLVGEEALTALYEEAVLYAYPSPDEDFGMGIVEAMARGTPVVAWNHGGPTISVENNVTGFLAEPGSRVDFSDKIHRLASNPRLVENMGRAAHKRALEKFSFERHNRVLEESMLNAVAAHESLRHGATFLSFADNLEIQAENREVYVLVEDERSIQ